MFSGNRKRHSSVRRKGVVMRISRRAFLLIAAYAAPLIGMPKTAFASKKKESDTVQFTEEMALEFADTFVQGVGETSGLVPSETTKIYDPALGAIGYIVDIVDAFGSPHGYVIYDVTDDSLISEYSLEPGAISPYASVTQDIPMLYRDDDSSVIALKTEPFFYVAAERDSGIVLSAPETYGYDMDTSIPLSSTPDSGSWDDIFFDNNLTRNSKYQITEHVLVSTQEFMSFAEKPVEAQTGSYACAVSALLCCTRFYISSSLSYKDFSLGNGLKRHYDALWSLSGTEEIYIKDEVRYGSTPNNRIGPALVSYCSQYGKSVTSNFITSLSFPLFRSTVKRGDMGVFCCGINLSGKIHSHAMAVGGCLVAQPKGTSKPSMHALVVADGWNGYARYVNVGYTKYTYNDSVFFSR